jgi:hypothetical protein
MRSPAKCCFFDYQIRASLSQQVPFSRNTTFFALFFNIGTCPSRTTVCDNDKTASLILGALQNLHDQSSLGQMLPQLVKSSYINFTVNRFFCYCFAI